MQKSAITLRIPGNYPDYKGQELQTFDNPTWWQNRGLMYTATGYGRKIPTQYMVQHNNRLKRVYCCIYSNIGTLFIIDKGKDLTVTD